MSAKRYRSTQSHETAVLAAKLLAAHDVKTGGLSWPAIARKFGIMTAAGAPNPGLAWEIAHGAQPGPDVCRRLGLPVRCSACGEPIRKHRPHHHVPPWVDAAVVVLVRLQSSGLSKTDRPRVYTNSGKVLFLDDSKKGVSDV